MTTRFDLMNIEDVIDRCEDAMTTPTPRTDAAQLTFAGVNGMVRYAVPADFARQLERELVAAQVELERVRDKCNEHYMALAAAQEALDAKDARIKELEGALLRTGAWEIAPCCICGYNGPGYYQPDTHACANRAREALK